MNGMNGMTNMGMGFNAGQGAFGGFNGQSDGWMAGQENYNAYGANGNFGAHAGHGGYNTLQGNFNQMNHQQYPHNDFQNGYNRPGFNNRGRGRRGPGYYGAGRGRDGYGYNQHPPQNYNQMNPGNHSGNANPDALAQQVAPSAGKTQQDMGESADGRNPSLEAKPDGARDPMDPTDATQAAAEHPTMEGLDPGGEDGEDVAKATESTDRPTGVADGSSTGEKVDGTGPQGAGQEPAPTEAPVTGDGPAEPTKESKPLPIQTFISDEPRRRPYENAAMATPGADASGGQDAGFLQDASHDQGGWGRGGGRGGFYRGGAAAGRGRGAAYLANGGGLHGSIPVVPLAEPKGMGVAGAPTGPKALRQGLPNTGLSGRGFNIMGKAGAPLVPKTNSHGVTRRSNVRSHACITAG
jgi:hypothetical protein